MTKEELRKEFYRKFTYEAGDGYRMDTSVAVPPRVFDFFCKLLSEKEELLKAAMEVISVSKHLGLYCSHGDTVREYNEALEKYNSLKSNP